MSDSCRACTARLTHPSDSGVRDFEYGTPGEWSYASCPVCGALSITPLPDEEVLTQAYPPSYHAYMEHASPLAARLKRLYWRRLARAVVRRAGMTARVLDVGCARGDLLSELRDMGIRDMAGVEFSPDAGEVLKERGFTLAGRVLEEVGPEQGPFDIIIMINVIEHVHNPASMLRHAAGLLSESGLILGETPNHKAWDHRLFGRLWGGYHAPRHLTVFNERSLQIVGKSAGLELKEFSNIIQPAHWALSVQNWMQQCNLGPAVCNGRNRLFPFFLLAATPLNIIQAAMGKTSSIAFAFRKNTPMVEPVFHSS